MFWSHPRPDGSARFHFPPSHHREVFVTGTFCGWRQPGVPLRREPSGWSADVPDVGDDVEYKFIADGEWLADPNDLGARDAHGNCGWRRHGRGSCHALAFHSPALGGERRYAVYLPAGWATSGLRYPTLYLLHGALDGERAWLERGGLASTLDALRASGRVGDLIVVMPYEPGDLFRGDPRVASYLADDVVGHVDFELPTLASGEHRAIDGLSTGGFGSLAMAAKRPDRFRSVGSMSGSYTAGLTELVRSAADAMKRANQSHLVSCGRDEPHLAGCRNMYEHLRGLGLDATWRDVPGIHDWPVWRALLADHLTFHGDHVGRAAP